MSSEMAMNNCVFQNGEGLVKDNIENTVSAICEMAKDGMKNTDEKILEIMLKK